MKSNSQVRRPHLTSTTVDDESGKRMSVGDTLRQAKSDLFFRRCLLGIVLVLLITAIVFVVVMGYADSYLDRFFAMMS